jgi:hypothetical protein
MIHVKGGVQKKVEKELRRLPMVSALGTFVLCLQHEIQPILMPSQASCGEEMRVDRERERAHGLVRMERERPKWFFVIK